MIDFLNHYLVEIEEKISGKKTTNWKKTLKHHRETIKFMQHERLIHLLVTLAFGVKFLVAMMFTLVTHSTVLMAIDLLFLVLLVPYIFYYFKLENGVQKLYWIDRLIQDKLSGGRG